MPVLLEQNKRYDGKSAQVLSNKKVKPQVDGRSDVVLERNFFVFGNGCIWKVRVGD